MKKITLLTALFITTLVAFSQQKFSSVPGQEAAFNAKYSLSASIDEQTMILKFITNAPVSKAILSTYTKAQLAVRKGTDNIYPFNTPVKEYQFKLNAPVYKGFFAYWLKIYTSDGLFQEYYFQQKSVPAIKQPVTDRGQEASGTKIKTNISCKTGADKTISALKKLDGVFSVSVDIKTGVLTIDYSSDGTPYSGIVEEINNVGFNADRSLAKVSKNPCTPSIRVKQ
ncbi:MAG: heavy-metal-associated domain-containing protein [Ferruginibacter sp.]